MRSVFSKILSGEIPASFVYRDSLAAAFMDSNPINAGHVLIVPLSQVCSLSDLDDESCARLMILAKRVSKALRETAIACEGINLLLSEGQVAGQEVPHVHLHVVPRFKGDRFSISCGLEGILPPKRDELDLVATKIRAKL